MLVFNYHKLSLGAGLLCECDEFCPDHHYNNYTCATNEGYCFAKLHFDVTNKTIVRTHGCTADTHDGGIFQCRHKKHERPTVMLCCKDGDYCNSHLKPTMKISTDHKVNHDGMLTCFRLFFAKKWCFVYLKKRVKSCEIWCSAIQLLIYLIIVITTNHHSSRYHTPHGIALVISITVCVMLLIILVTFLYFR